MSKPKILQAIDEIDYTGFYNNPTNLGDLRTDGSCLNQIKINGIYVFTGGANSPTDSTGSYKWSLRVYTSEDNSVVEQLAERMTTDSGKRLLYIRAFKNNTWSSFISANDYLPISGGVLSGYLTLHSDPTESLHAATKQYVDNEINTRAALDDNEKVVANQTSSYIVSVTSSKTLVATDAGTMQYCTNTSSIIITIPKNVFDIGTEIEIVRYGAGSITLSASSGVKINGVSGGTITMGDRYSVVALKCLDATSWIISGGVA